MAHPGENKQGFVCEEHLKLYDTGCLKPVSINLDNTLTDKPHYKYGKSFVTSSVAKQADAAVSKDR